MSKIAFFDIDGVLANETHRVDHALNQRWTEYFRPEALAADAVWEQGREALAEAQADGWTIAYMTGRREDLRAVTANWLHENGFPPGTLVMRPMDVKVPLAILKADTLERIVASEKFLSVMLYDDDPEVVRIVRERLGEDFATHCTWHVKQSALVKAATA